MKILIRETTPLFPIELMVCYKHKNNAHPKMSVYYCDIIRLIQLTTEINEGHPITVSTPELRNLEFQFHLLFNLSFIILRFGTIRIAYSQKIVNCLYNKIYLLFSTLFRVVRTTYQYSKI